MKANKNSNKHITAKANNTGSIRILYKKAGQTPEVKIIDNIFKLKKAIIDKKLVIIPYENLFIICNNKKLMETMTPNIALIFNSIKGDLILVDIDKNAREFKGLSQEDIIWYSQDLINKSFNNKQKTKSPTTRKLPEFHERDYEYNSNNKLNHFEKELINVLVNIELVLASLLRNGDTKNE